MKRKGEDDALNENTKRNKESENAIIEGLTDGLSENFGRDRTPQENHENKNEERNSFLKGEFNIFEEKRITESDNSVMKEIKEKLERQDKEIQEELKEMRNKYYLSHFKITFEKLPAAQGILNIQDIEPTDKGYLRAYSFAKVCVDGDIKIKRVTAVTTAADAFATLVTKYVHLKFIVPLLKDSVSQKTLEHAFTVFQENLGGTVYSDLHKIAYVIQEEMEKKEPMKIPNPYYERIMQQLIAASKYATEILKVAAVSKFKCVEVGLMNMMSDQKNFHETQAALF